MRRDNALSFYGAYGIHYDRDVGRFILLLVGIEVC